MPIVQKPSVGNPLLDSLLQSADPSDFLSPVGMAARIPSRFLLKKFASKVKRDQEAVQKLAELMEAAQRTKVGAEFQAPILERALERMENPELYRVSRNQPGFLELAMDDATDLVQSNERLNLKRQLYSEAELEKRRRNDALDLWRLRNMGIQEATKKWPWPNQ